MSNYRNYNNEARASNMLVARRRAAARRAAKKRATVRNSMAEKYQRDRAQKYSGPRGTLDVVPRQPDKPMVGGTTAASRRPQERKQQQAPKQPLPQQKTRYVYEFVDGKMVKVPR